MTMQYVCDLCKKTFNKKMELTRHKKTPCVSIDNTQQNNNISHINFFKLCLNILRDNEGLTGENALRNMSYFLILKLIEPRFDDTIDIDNYAYDFSHIIDENGDKHRKKL